MTCLIPIAGPIGLFASVDEKDYEYLSQFKWLAYRKGLNFTTYATSRLGASGRGVVAQRMHRVILQATPEFHVDHIDGNGLNNTRANIRLCSRSENQWNRGPRRDSSSGYKGVTWDSRRRCWVAQVWALGKNHHLGLFDDPIEAHTACCAFRGMHHREFCKNE